MPEELPNEVTSELEAKMQQQVQKYEYVLAALSDIGDELCRVISFDAQLKSLLHLLLGTLGIRKGGIFIYDEATQKLNLKCAWKIAHKQYEYDISKEQIESLSNDSNEITYRVSEFNHVKDLLSAFEVDKLDCVSVLKVRERFIGLLIVGHKLKDISLTEKEVTFLKTLSRNISVAINNYLMLNELRATNAQLDEKMREVSVLYQASQMISSELQIGTLMDMALNAINGFTTIQFGTAWLYDDEHKAFNLAAKIGNINDVPKSIKLEQSAVLQYATDKRDSFEIKNQEDDLVTLTETDIKIFGKVFVAVPIVNQGEMLGLVQLCDSSESNCFSARDLRLIKVFAIQLGAAVKKAQLYEQAITDGMTKLYLHRYFKQRLADEIKRAARFKRNLALVMVDIDHFKLLNDNYGHQTGDEVLKHVAAILRGNVRTHDLPVRYGGEEFCLVLPETDMIGAVAVAERVRKAVENEVIEYGGATIRKTASFGVSVFPDCASDMDSLIKAADVALYWSKEHGRNQVTAAPSIAARESE